MTDIDWQNQNPAWRWCYKRIYKVSSTGLVVRDSSKRILKHGLSKGYYQVTLSERHRRINAKVHRLVALAFLKPPLPGQMVNHKDGNKLNNHASNLEWVTNRENLNHAKSIGTMPLTPRSRLDELQIKMIRKYFGKIPTVDLAKLCRIGKTTVREVANGNRFKFVD